MEAAGSVKGQRACDQVRFRGRGACHQGVQPHIVVQAVGALAGDGVWSARTPRVEAHDVEVLVEGGEE